MARKMKASGVEWIGDIPLTWHEEKHKYLFSCGKEIVGNDSANTQLLSLTTQGVKKKSSDAVGGKLPESFDTYQLVKRDDLIMCLFDLDCSAVFSGLSPFSGMISPAYKVLKCSSKILPEFADYWFKFVSDGRKFKPYAKNLRYTLNYDEFACIPMVLPEKEEQARIASFLDRRCAEIDSVIAETRRTIEEYKALKQSIITEAVTKGVRGKRPMKDSGIEWIGEIPEEWKVQRIKTIFSLRDERNYLPLEEVNLISLYTDLGVVQHSELEKTTGNKASNADGYKLVYENDIVVNIILCWMGAIGRSAYSGVTSPAYDIYVPSNDIDCRFYHHYFRTTGFSGDCYKRGRGIMAMRWRTYSDQFRDIKVVVPSLNEQREILKYLNEKCDQIDMLIERKRKLLDELESYKKSVIYEYVTGKKEVPAEQADVISIVYPYFPATLHTNKRRFAQAILMCRILDQCPKKMGRVKLEKMLFTIENSIGFDFETEYERAAAGPLDVSIYACEGIISRVNQWYTIKTSNYGVSYVPTKDSSKYKKYYDKYFSSYDQEIARIINFFKDYDADEAEITATLFAAWNDFLIDHKQFSDAELVDEVLNNWNDSKKRFSREIWLGAIAQMRESDIVPKGYGKHTVRKSE